MKSKISITVDKEVLDLIENTINDKKGVFRNRSHVIEYSVKKLLNENKGGKEK
ncbi:MAG: ribbon-helix-helix domain-containing protein [Candidatus Pacearchaeota archaeon]|jgi:Arc/MetJ-type ribon-helix-helix transcriptional regulator